jgi:hypothetical protein
MQQIVKNVEKKTGQPLQSLKEIGEDDLEVILLNFDLE